MHTHTHTHACAASGLAGPCFHLIYLWALPLPIREWVWEKADLRTQTFHGFFHFKTKDYSINVYNTHLPFADPGRGVEIKDSCLFFENSGD